MKAKLPEGIKLSIGMIVKNEERHIRNCLEALKPLREQVKCELIIADTGSTDRTFEIAQEYTDQVFHFEWCDDFSAARNATLDRAQGEWFMFLDADEYLKDPADLVDFVSGTEQKRYKLATIVIRSYTDEMSESWNDFRGVRLCKKSTGNRFTNKIHETFFMVRPVKNLNTYVDHYGYVYQTVAQLERKRKRNMDLMEKQYEENSEDPRLLVLLFDSSADNEKKLEWMKHAVSLLRDNPSHPYYGSSYLRLVEQYQTANDESRAVETAREYLANKNPEEMAIDIDMYAILANCLATLQRYEESADAYEKYFELHDKYHEGLIDSSDMMYTPINYIHPMLYQGMLLKAAKCFVNLQRYDETFDLLSHVDLKSMRVPDLRTTIVSLYYIVEKSKQSHRLIEYYGRVRELENEDMLDCYVEISQKYYYDHTTEREAFAHAFADCAEWQDDTFIRLMKLVDTQENTLDFKAKLNDFLIRTENWKAGFSEAIYLSLKYKVSLTHAIRHQTYEQMEGHLQAIVAAHPDYAELVLAYSTSSVLGGSLSELRWSVFAQQHALLATKQLDKAPRLELSNLFIQNLALLVTNIYNPELFNDEDVRTLPSLHRFGFYMGRAQLCLDEGLEVEYIHGVRDALKNCESMRETVQLILEDFETKRNERLKTEKEMDQTAVLFKKKVMELARSGMKEQARDALESYRKLHPEDMQVDELMAKIGQ